MGTFLSTLWAQILAFFSPSQKTITNGSTAPPPPNSGAAATSPGGGGETITGIDDGGLAKDTDGDGVID